MMDLKSHSGLDNVNYLFLVILYPLHTSRVVLNSGGQRVYAVFFGDSTPDKVDYVR